MGPVRQKPNPVNCQFCSYVCASHCAQLLHTILHRTDLIIFPLTLQTISDDVYLREEGVRQCQKISSPGLYGARGDIRGRHTDNPAGHHSIRTNEWPTSLMPHFYVGCPSCCNPPNLSGLGTGTKYAGLHTEWLGVRHWASRWMKSVTPGHCNDRPIVNFPAT